MDKLFKGRKRKGPKVVTRVPSQNATPSTSTLASTERSDLPIERIDWALEIAGIVTDISEASPLLAPLKATCLLIIRGLEVARVMVLLRAAVFSSYASMKETHQTRLNLQEITEVLKKQEKDIEEFAVRLEGGDMKGSPVLQSKLEIYLKNIHEALAGTTAPVKETKGQRFDLLRRTRPTTSTQEEIPNIKQKLNSSYRDFMDAALLVASEKIEDRAYLAIRMHEVSKKVEYLNQQEQVEQLEDEPEYDYDSPLPLLYGHGIPCCQPGTRTAILADIEQWAMDTGTKEKIYWLKDAAGTGKTTVAATCARDWQVKQTLAGRFFFTPNSEASSGIDRFCTTVAKDIAFLVPSIDSVITAVLDELSRWRCGFHEQFERLIVNPFRSAKLSHPVVLIFDALDNCDPDGRRILLNCLLEHLPNIPHVKVLITSRPSPDIVDILSTSSFVKGQEAQLLDIHDEVRTDVRIYVHSALNRLDNEEREKLVEYSGGLFIVAATACRMLRLSREPAKLLNKLLTSENKDHLDELYLEVLRQAVWNAGAHEKMMSVLQIIIVAFQPVSINTISRFLPARFDVGRFVQDLGAVLKDGHPERPIKVLHPTFREFLAEFNRANGFLVNTPSSHALTAIGCLDALEKCLDYDVLKLREARWLLPRNTEVPDLDKRLTMSTTAAERYASSYWTYHVAASLEHTDVWSKTLKFLSTKLLNWIELMSWRGDISMCIQGFSRLRHTSKLVLRDRPKSLEQSGAATISQIYQFLLLNQPVIQDSALQAYSSALAFTPDGSPLFDRYRERHSHEVPKILTAIPTSWTMHSVLSGHSSHLRQLKFSPDGSRLVTTSEDCTLILWDTDSGAIVGHPFRKGTRNRVEHVAFSHDGQKLVFGTKDSKLHIWSAASGINVASEIDAGPGELVQVTFSPSPGFVISASTETQYNPSKMANNMALWNMSDGQKVGQTMLLDGGARCLAISPDGSRVACVSKHAWQWEVGIASLWSLESFEQLARYEMPVIYQKPCLVYSPLGNRFVTWDQVGNLYFRNGTSGNEVARIEGPEKGMVAASFSPNGAILASYGGESPIIYLWDATGGDLKFSLLGHTRNIKYISFNPDGGQLASISSDQTVLVWDTTTGASLKTFFSGYIGNVSHPVLSPDWTKLVTVSITHQINLYDSNDGTMHGKAIKDGDMNFAVPHVAFSPTGDLMICGYADLNDESTLGLWSLETSKPVGVSMLGHTSGIHGVSFSPDAKYVATVSTDGTMRLWDGFTGSPLGQPLVMSDGKHVMFSSDSRLVASSSYNAICIWEVQGRVNVWSINRPSNSDSIIFASKSSKLAGAFEDKICIWDVASGLSTIPIAESEKDVEFNTLAFSPSDDLIASCSSGRIRIWKVLQTLQLVAEIPNKVKLGFQLGISFDGGFLAYGSSVWDISSLPDTPMLVQSAEPDLPPFNWNAFPHSLLTYDAGWIHAPCASGSLMPVPSHLRGQFRVWHAYESKVVVWTQSKLPVIIDCSPLLMSFQNSQSSNKDLAASN